MYEAFYGFTRPPFPAVPLADDYFPAESMEQARQTLVRALDRAEGVGVVIGAAGTGKSLLCQVLAQHFRRRMRVVLLANTQLSTRRSLLQSILFELKLPFRNLEEGEMRLALMDHLEPTSDSAEGMLLVLDEAHTIPLRLLEEIRLLSNMVRDGVPRVRLVLAGNSRLEEHLAHPRLESFQQRIAARCYLEPFQRQEVYRYVRQALDRVGPDADELITDDALAKIVHLTDGVPRLINQLGDHALLMGFGAEQRMLDAQLIEEAWADLQRLPLPSSATSPNPFVPRDPDAEAEEGVGSEGGMTSGDSVVEFGPLDESSETWLDTPSIAADSLDSSPVTELGELAKLAERAEDLQDKLHEQSPTPIEQDVAGPRNVEDPFGGPFASEEVVLDGNWTSWRAESLARVAGPESHAFKAALAILSSAKETTSPNSPSERKDPSSAPGGRVGPEQVLAVGESDVPTPESMPRPLQPEGLNIETSAERLIGLWDPASQPVDDRDIILVDEDQDQPEGEVAERMTKPRASRQEYRRLFGRLRQPA